MPIEFGEMIDDIDDQLNEAKSKITESAGDVVSEEAKKMISDEDRRKGELYILRMALENKDGNRLVDIIKDSIDLFFIVETAKKHPNIDKRRIETEED